MLTNDEIMKMNRETATEWFFRVGHKGMNKLEQVAYLITECGYTEAGAWGVVYGCEDK